MSRQPKIGEKVWVKKISSDKPCTVKSINWIYVNVRPLHAHKDIEVMISDIEFISPEVLTGKEKCEIVNRLVDPNTFKENMSNFYRELSTLNNLIKKYPNLDFWREFTPNFKVKSLIWWFGGGAIQMNDFYNFYSLDFKVKKDTIGTVKLGEDIKIEKQQTLKDILN